MFFFNIIIISGCMFWDFFLFLRLPLFAASLAHPVCQGYSGSGSGNYQPHPCQSQLVAEPSSEEDYPSISISHTLISRVSLLSFVSATRQPERRGFSLLVDGEVLACTQRREEGGEEVEVGGGEGVSDEEGEGENAVFTRCIL